MPNNFIFYETKFYYFILGSVADFLCEPDEYALLVENLKKSGIIKDNRSGLRSIKNSFSGKQFVDWVVEHKNLSMLLII